MKLAISTIIQIILLGIGLPFIIMKKVGKYGVIAIEKACDRLNWWGRK